MVDGLSKKLDSDSWGIDAESYNYIQSKFGIFTYDRFADHINSKVDKFDSNFFCPGANRVNTFSIDWKGELNWVCPPISQIGKSLKHFQSCKAKGVLLVPEWRSAYYWPLLIAENGKKIKVL